jgi:hypothetical protein
MPLSSSSLDTWTTAALETIIKKADRSPVYLRSVGHSLYTNEDKHAKPAKVIIAASSIYDVAVAGVLVPGKSTYAFDYNIDQTPLELISCLKDSCHLGYVP